MRSLWSIFTVLALMHPLALWAETYPGRASGSIGDRTFDIALDCKGWQVDERMVFAAGDEHNGSDTNGDGVALSFNYFAPMDTTNAQLTLDGQVHYMASGLVRPEGAPVWVVDDTTAHWFGDVPTPVGMVTADVTLDCGKRDAAARGLNGRVTGSFGTIAVDMPLDCGTWQNGNVELSTEQAARPQVQAFYVREMKNGALVFITEDRQFQIGAAGIMKTAFEETEDTLRFAHDIRDKQTGAMIAVDLTFDCSTR